jgi:hypothetical protein
VIALLDIAAIRKTVVTGLKDYLGIPVIRSNQTGEPPKYPYLSYGIITLASANNGTWGEYEDGIDRKPVTQTWSITVQSNDVSEAMEYTLKAREWFEHVGRLYLNDNDIIVQTVGNIGNRDNMLTIEYEYRNGFDVVLWFLSEVKNPSAETGYIESVQLVEGKVVEKQDTEQIMKDMESELEEHEALAQKLANRLTGR